MNQEGINYNSSNFIDSAFTDEEKSAISDTNVVNNNNLDFGTEGGNDTVDKVFLLSESEIYTDNAVIYGFISSGTHNVQARRCKSSDYAKAMGVIIAKSTDYNENCQWWLRSLGNRSNDATIVSGYCRIGGYGDIVSHYSNGVRVVLNLNLSASNHYTYAVTVCSDEQ